jgi:hypothetical protein
VSDGRFGLVTGLDDGFEQLPLRVSVAGVSDPCGLLGASAVTALAAGPDSDRGRAQARLNALAAYGSVVVDPRLLVDRDGVFLGASDADPVPMLASASAARTAFVRGIDLASGRTRLVEAHKGFPVLSMPPAEPYHVPCGTAAALSWDAALAQALAQHCLRLTVAGELRRAPEPAGLAVADFGRDPVVEYCRVMLEAAGLDVVLENVTGPLGVPVVACTSATTGTVHGCGTDLTQAAGDALLRLLLRHQSRNDPRLASAAIHASLPLLAPGMENTPSASSGVGRLTAALAGAGRFPVVFPLDHDPVLGRVMPFALRVVLEAADA